jgi:hypothetical protein
MKQMMLATDEPLIRSMTTPILAGTVARIACGKTISTMMRQYLARAVADAERAADCDIVRIRSVLPCADAQASMPAATSRAAWSSRGQAPVALQ